MGNAGTGGQMVAPPDETTADPYAVIATLRAERDAALTREAALAEVLAARTAALAQRDTEYRERIEYQAATIDVLKVMSASPGDPQPVFDLIVRRATELCDVPTATLNEYDGELVHARSFYGVETMVAAGSWAAHLENFPMRPTRGVIGCRAILDRRVIHIRDLEADPELADFVRELGQRSQVSVPLIRNGLAIGVISISARGLGGFSDHQIELLKTFAEQAVIAITSAETYRALQTRTRDLQETLEYQTAISDVLKVISRSAFDLQPVLDTVVETAARLCDADQAVIGRRDGDKWRLAANFGFPPEYEAYYRERGLFSYAPDTPSSGARVARERRIVHIDDVAAVPGYPEASIRLGKQRTSLGVPLLRDGEVIGNIILARQRVEPFTERQIELVSTFANQAVIAIENARLLTEQREALEQQTATAEVLQVINSSPGDLAPVFNAILQKAHSLCGADHASLTVRDGDRLRAVATYAYSEAWAERLRDGMPVVDNPVAEALLEGADFVHYPDLAEIDHPLARASVDATGVRTALFVPLRKDGVLLGHISAVRQGVRPFTDKQIAFLQNFAAQASVAMENARLINETREALEQQTATAEVLQAINSSPGNLAPVFDAMLSKAMRLCGAAFGELYSFNGENFAAVAVQGVPSAFAEFRARHLTGTDPRTITGRVRSGEPIVHVVDCMAEDIYREGEPTRRALVDLGGARTVLAVPLRKDEALLGMIMIYRQEVRPFSDKQIALLKNFAAQAVIAMENARLLGDLRQRTGDLQEALEQQTATAEVLQVINASPGQLAPVFDAMLNKAVDLCGAAFGILLTYDGERFHHMAFRSIPAAYVEFMREHPPIYGPESAPGRLAHGERLVHMLDITDTDVYRSGDPNRRAIADLAGARTIVTVALQKDSALIGAIAVFRQEVRAFSDKQIALLENFAAQGVIAMENARLLTQQREALEQQTAVAEVLQVINASPGNLTPVFDAMLDKAMRLCGADYGHIHSFDGQRFDCVAIQGDPEFVSWRRRRGPVQLGTGASPLNRLMGGESVVHVSDALQDEGYRKNPRFRELIDASGIRSTVAVALRKEQTLVGVIIVYRREVRPFSDTQIALLQNFAAQAVIAMENARLIIETHEALEQQTATAEVLRVINSSPGDLTPVFDAILEKAHTVCGASLGALALYDNEHEQVRAVATRGYPEEYATLARKGNPPQLVTAFGRLQRGERVVHVPDAAALKSPAPMTRAAIEIGGVRTSLTVPLRRGNTLLGYISAHRQEVRPFSEREIALLENFATQAVIAMENARLITETREALEQQTATAEVLQVINAAPGNLAPVFDAILEKAHSLCGAAKGTFVVVDGDQLRLAASRGLSEAFIEVLKRLRGFERGSPPEQLLNGAAMIQLVGPAISGGSIGRVAVKLEGIGAVLFIPLRRHDALLGYITAYRQEEATFSEKQIALLQGFAAQAVIAMENARLITETREALEQQSATAEILQVINSSPGNLTPVFDTILDKAHTLCGAALGSLMIFEDGYAHATATHGFPEEHAELVRQPYRISGNPKALLDGARLIHTLDVQSEELHPGDNIARSAIGSTDIRTGLWVPLRKDGALLGWITAFRLEVRPFSDKEIALLESFAAQAVIAMESARLLSEIRQRQDELRITFENMGDGVALFDETRHLVASNRRFQEMLDVPDDVIVSRPSFSDYIRYLAGHGEYGPDPEDHVQQLLALGSQRRTFERTRPNGRIIEIRVNPIPGGGFVVIYADITERKRNEEEIRTARDAAEEASRTIEAAYRDLKAAQANLIQAEKMASLGQLTAGIAHEIKNPLNFVNNFAELSGDLLDELHEVVASNRQDEIDELTATLKGNLAKIAEHGKRADGIVRSMLEHSRGSSGERRSVDLNTLVDEALNLAYHGARARDQSFNVALQRELGEGIAPITLVPQDITRVLLNLFSNGFYAAHRRQAMEATPGFEPELGVATRELGDAVEIRVRDNGIGILEEVKDKLFQPFFTTKPTGEGTGLGLSISYDIVTQQHGGSIAVDSKVGEFSEFTIRLPRNP
jgi:GAF domain-containing protein/signal transduction histidine kinase